MTPRPERYWPEVVGPVRPCPVAAQHLVRRVAAEHYPLDERMNVGSLVNPQRSRHLAGGSLWSHVGIVPYQVHTARRLALCLEAPAPGSWPIGRRMCR